MLHFENDYNKGAHPVLLEALVASNQEGLSGYGTDCYTQSAIDKIRQAIACPQAQITFLAGGTQTNQIAINSMLASYEGVIAADTGHISTHEAGAIEFSGHKVLTLPHHEGKITASEVDNFIKDFYADANHAHMVHPGMVYISHPTEYGTLYSKAELTDLARVCRRYQIPLYLDGARLGYGLASLDTDVDLPAIAELTDLFYIGGTKMGALLAKGRVVGVQFDRLFTDDLYMSIGRHAIDMAEQLKAVLVEKGYRFYLNSPTNQQFIIVKNEELPKLSESGIAYSFWEKYDDSHSIIRFATSWSTSQADIERLKEIL
ncbi:TPA: low specificity L-threonine aldolase [Streptococcus suis]